MHCVDKFRVAQLRSRYAVTNVLHEIESKVKLSRYRHLGAKKERSVVPSLLSSALQAGEWSASRPDRASTPGKNPDWHWTEGWVDYRAGLNTRG
jgi:hypothetical protein